KVERPIIFISRRTSKAKMSYHSNALECLALVWASRMPRSSMGLRQIKTLCVRKGLHCFYGQLCAKMVL
ncbi:Uncharacterized protein APZ42_004749, partial [Daphnia magna]